MRRLPLIAFVALLVSGCASQIMNSYVGKDVRDAMLDYGPPANAFDMSDGRRAFQWAMQQSYTAPVSATTTSYVNSSGPTAWVSSNTTIHGGQTINSHCIYTIFGRWDEANKGWTITGYKKPKILCE